MGGIVARFRQQSGERVRRTVSLAHLLETNETIVSVIRTDTFGEVLLVTLLSIAAGGKGVSFVATGGLPTLVYPLGLDISTSTGSLLQEVVQFIIEPEPCLEGPDVEPPPPPEPPPLGYLIDVGEFTNEDNTGSCPL